MIEIKNIEDYIKEYSGLVKLFVNKYLSKAQTLGIEYNDLYQEGLLGLTNAIKTYKDEKDTQFKTYASYLIERQIKDYIKSNNRFKHSMLNESVSLDQGNNFELYNALTNKETPETDLLALELDSEIKKKLTELEYKVYELRKDGNTNKMISKILGIPIKNIENTLNRIKIKIKKELNK